MFPEFRIKQERTPPRIYRPDLELQGYFSGVGDSTPIIENPFTTAVPKQDIINPFAPDPYVAPKKVEDIIIPISKNNFAINKTPSTDNIPF